MSITLKRLRKSKKMTQDEAAETLGISLSYMKKLESGIRKPSHKLTRKIVENFGREYVEKEFMSEDTQSVPH